MSNNVFANGREISCKAASGKTICAMPDVCMTPPENPATPPGVPVPYPNTGMASDTTKGSKKVKISNKEVGLKNKSYFKKSVGDEAGSAAKKGVITSTNRGKVYFNSWSMDVKVEGANVVRHLDITTHNHASQIGQTPPFPEIDGMSAGVVTITCKDDWTPCQKAQARAKVAEMNKMCPLTRKPGISAADGLAASTRDLGNAFAKGFKSHFKAMQKGTKSRSQWIRSDRMPKGDDSDFMDPCMKEELEKNPNAIDNWSADHVQDLQFGGSESGPFKMLDKNVNQSLGSQMSNGPQVVAEFKT
ncbi:DUF4150 domain-containing protein, partial [Malonomonas rubra]|uniref:DUF4150 domain-containing protein n=1 Tax=Malonomonas rubra TaxID=57040 RepID=UPI0026EF32E5